MTGESITYFSETKSSFVDGNTNIAGSHKPTSTPKCTPINSSNGRNRARINSIEHIKETFRITGKSRGEMNEEKGKG